MNWGLPLELVHPDGCRYAANSRTSAFHIYSVHFLPDGSYPSSPSQTDRPLAVCCPDCLDKLDLFLISASNFNPDSEKTPLKILLSLSCIDSAEKWRFHRKRAPFHLEKQVVAGVSRRRWNRALHSPPTEMDV